MASGKRVYRSEVEGRDVGLVGTFPTCSDRNAIAAIGPGAEVRRPLFRDGKAVVGGLRVCPETLLGAA
jgi:hypothetical protein